MTTYSANSNCWKEGWIAKDDPVPPGIQLTRALDMYGLVDERIKVPAHENVGKTGRMRSICGEVTNRSLSSPL